tara:strand:+ start:46 stop:612 length:567 start_codon:yes stop_codon:yes gene_type:complete
MPCKKCKDENYKYGNTGECKYATKEACEKANPKKYNKMQPTPLGKKTYAEYEKELKEFNLSKVERVELGLVDDAARIGTAGEKLRNLAQRVSNQSIKESDELLKLVRASGSKLEKRLSKLEELKKDLNKQTDESLKLERKIDKAAKELGVSPDKLPGKKLLDRNYKENTSLLETVESAIDKVNDVLVI